MKQLILHAAICLSLTSCFKTEETFEIKQDNTGTYSLNMNMDGMLSQLKSMASMSGQEMPENIPAGDTAIAMKSFTDTASALTDDEKKLLSRGTFYLHADEDKDELSFKFVLPFDNLQQMIYLKQNAFKLMGKLKPQGDAMPGMDMGSDNPLGNMDNMNPMQNAFSFSAENNIISNKLTDTANLSNLSAGENFQMIKTMLTMMGDMTNTVTFILPSPVKKYSGPESKLSDDKKTITFITSLSDQLDKPSAGEYSVEY